MLIRELEVSQLALELFSNPARNEGYEKPNCSAGTLLLGRCSGILLDP
uniref:Uncharacterized protein n=1 Tax=Arundo donax TaxID=35708 RepID=A0A0A9BN48_ARUDO